MEKINLTKVENMYSPDGNEVPNQFKIFIDEATYFQSYDSIIAKKVGRQIYLDKDKWDYSKTTGKYRNMFLCETKRDTEKKIKSGEYILTNLN